MAETIDNDAFSRRRRRLFFLITGAAVVATIVGVGLLMYIFERKQEARNPFYRVVELTDDTEDPAVWGKNFPLQYDDYKRTVDQVRTRFGGSEALPRTGPSPRTAHLRSSIWRRTTARGGSSVGSSGSSLGAHPRHNSWRGPTIRRGR